MDAAHERADAARAGDARVRAITVEVEGHPFFVLEAGDGPAVLFCHGFPDTAETWRAQLVAVAAAGYRAIAIDMRGFGRSHSPQAAGQYSALHVAGDLVGVLDALGIRDAVLVGHDWGADHAQRASILRPDRFRALVSISIPFAPRADASHWDQLRRDGLGDRYYAFDMMAAGLPPAPHSIPSALYWLSGTPDPDERWDPIDPRKSLTRPAPAQLPDWIDADHLAHTIDAFTRTGFDTGLNHYRSVPATFALMSAFPRAVLTQPSLYVWGDADGLCRFFHPKPPTIDELRIAQPGLVGQVRLPGVGHWVQHEARDRLSEVLVAFLRELDAPGRARRARYTALTAAAGRGDTPTVRALVQAGADVHAVEPLMGATALHKAAQAGDVEAIAVLLDGGAFVDQVSPVLGHTPLMDAVQHKQSGAVALLLERGARTTARSHFQEDVHDHARAAGDESVVRLLAAADRGAHRGGALVDAVAAGDVDAVRRALDDGADIDARVPAAGDVDDLYTALGMAARDGRVELVRVLVARGADVTRLNGLMGATPAHEAAYGGHADVVRALAESGALARGLDLDAQGAYNGFTALHDAVWHGHADAARALVDTGASRDVRAHTGDTPLQLARRYGYDDIAALLANLGDS